VKRILAIASVLLAAAALVVFGTGAKDDGGDYRVRAIFMNAFSVIAGEDVKIAGVKVGKVESLDVTPDKRAAVVLRIDDPGFQDFRRDAECTIRPQSLIGEKFVECTPTQPRAEGAPPPPALRKIRRGPGKGQYLLPVTNTSRPVDLDLVANTLRLPFRQRLTIILNELGTGLAGRGSDLRLAIRNANPALKETDRVLAVLAGQNRVLAQLARDGDEILAPLARERASVTGFVDHANTVAVATAERSSALRENLALLPAFLRQLTPTMQQLGATADQMTPVLADLGGAAPNLNRVVEQLGPFSQAAIPAVTSLGDAAQVGGPALAKSRPIIEETGKLASTAKPLSANLASLLTSLRDTGGIERLMDFLFFQTTAINGYDSVGHYLRAGLILNACSTYTIKLFEDCKSGFGQTDEAAAARAASAGGVPGYADTRRSPSLRRLDAVLHGVPPGAVADPAPAAAPARPAPQAAPAPATPDRAARSVAIRAQDRSLLDYLLGGGS
jgi:ABC-type transporter Mla subunit MlaD